MKSIQLILIVLCLLAAILGSLAFRSKLGYRLLGSFFFITATAFVIFPDATSSIAHLLGVGRGADLLLYVGLLAGVYSFLLLYLRTRRLERRMTDQIRALAIRDAVRLGSEQPDGKPDANASEFATIAG
jgi:small membrane protein